MKKLFTLAFTATLMLLTQLAFSQNIILINGQASEVTLEGSQVTSVISSDIQDYMNGYDNPTDVEDIQKADLRMENAGSNNDTASIRKEQVLDLRAIPYQKPAFSIADGLDDK